VQGRAHEELDRVIGKQAWPSAEDEKQLPYVRAIIKEVQRVRPAFLVPAPHTSTEDFVYNGYYIPKGTGLVLNMYTLHRNEQRYPDA
jgi:cytochrome P450